MEKQENNSLFNNPDKVTSLIIGLILIIIILSQSFAINNNLGTVEIFRNILNHNSIYLFMLLYFVSLKTYLGKKYFNYLNTIVIFIYFVNMLTSMLTIFHTFSLTSLLSFALNIILFLYLFHVFFRGTRIWTDFKLNKSPFNELNNDWYFSVIVIISVMSLAVNLIFTTTLDGTVLALLDCLYIVLFTRYIFLYRNYLDKEKIDCKNEGNLNEIKETINEVVDDLGDSISYVANNVDSVINKVKQTEEKEQTYSKETTTEKNADVSVKKKTTTQKKSPSKKNTRSKKESN